MGELWPWAALVGLGAYHGLNPGMGWLFAVSLGLQERSRRGVTAALLPIAVGHELSVAVVVVVLGGALAAGSAAAVRTVGAVVLIAFGLLKLFRPRHPRWVGMRVNRRQLTAWSFLMSSAHGAGLMLLPVLVGLPTAAEGGAEASEHELLALGSGGVSLWSGGAAVLVHSAAMLAVMGVVAVVVYEKVGLGILRSAWVNMDLVWAVTLVVAGVFSLFT
ncbi:MAG: hypothetical protein M3535_05650 [Actinomycetota bacterium]|jgi:hypothetical protein|nr:hypothetical protein [Actinomycetota bacterium]MDQ3353688.1 hypothetical protein [Actinomycetota bacterium]